MRRPASAFAAALASMIAASAPPPASAADMPRLLSFVQYWSSLEARDEQAVNGCPNPVEGKLATGAYRAQLVFWLPDAPRDRLVKAWGALSLGWFVGRGGEVTSFVPLAFPLGAPGQPNPVRITDTNSKWPPLWHTGDPAPTNPIRFPSPTDGLVNRLLGGGLESKDRPLALLRLLCGWDRGEGLSHARIDAILGVPQSADITDVRDFLIPEEQGKQPLPDWPALLQRARDSKPPAFLSAGYLGDTVSDRHQALYRSFLARLEMTVPPAAKPPATQPQTPIPAGPALQDAAKSPIFPELPPDKPEPPKPDTFDMTWIWYVLTVVCLAGLAAFAVFWIRRDGAGVRWSRKDQEETAMDFYEELRRYSVDNINKMTDAVRVLGLAQENIAERLAGLESRFSEGGAVLDGVALKRALDERVPAIENRVVETLSKRHPELFSAPKDHDGERESGRHRNERGFGPNERHQKDHGSAARPASPPPAARLEEQLQRSPSDWEQADRRSPSNWDQADRRPPVPPDRDPPSPVHQLPSPTAAPAWSLDEAWLNMLTATLPLSDANRRRLLEATSLDEVGRRLVGEVLPIRTDTATLERIDAWLTNVSNGRLQLILPTVGSRPNAGETEKVAERQIERGIYGLVTAIVRPGLRIDGKADRRAEIEQGV